jgi:polysaccharide export outer membrane protein
MRSATAVFKTIISSVRRRGIGWPTAFQSWASGPRVLLLLLAVLGADWSASSVVHAEEFPYRLGAGERLRITVFGESDLSGEFVVGSDGTIAFPLVGSISATGRTLDELEAAIVDKLKPDYLKNPQVSLEILNYRPFYILGEVKNPGSYPYVNGMRVVNAIALAGGFTYRARQSKMTIKRAEHGRTEAADGNTVVLPGDVIEVPERFF